MSKKFNIEVSEYAAGIYELESPYTYAAPWLSMELRDSARTYF